MSDPKDVTSLKQWVARATPGEPYTYHTGLLMMERGAFSNTEKVAHTAWRLHERGLVRLVQRRISDDTCEYVAVRTARRMR